MPTVLAGRCTNTGFTRFPIIFLLLVTTTTAPVVVGITLDKALVT
jgi:hypothetical protein